MVFKIMKHGCKLPDVLWPTEAYIIPTSGVKALAMASIDGHKRAQMALQ